MNELTEFLLARFAEDEEVARAATPGPWFANGAMDENSQVGTGTGVVGRTVGFPGVDRRGDVVSDGVEGDGGAWWPDAQHIARHDPARVLAECDAKRRIVEQHSDVHDCSSVDWAANDFGGAGWIGCDVPRLLALPYADHKDYREEWRP
jgi:hypothetical protein